MAQPTRDETPNPRRFCLPPGEERTHFPSMCNSSFVTFRHSDDWIHIGPWSVYFFLVDGDVAYGARSRIVENFSNCPKYECLRKGKSGQKPCIASLVPDRVSASPNFSLGWTEPSYFGDCRFVVTTDPRKDTGHTARIRKCRAWMRVSPIQGCVIETATGPQGVALGCRMAPGCGANPLPVVWIFLLDPTFSSIFLPASASTQEKD